MTAMLDYRWHLRRVMADRGMFATTDLIEPLARRGIQLSSSQVYRLVAERPERLSLKILMALLDILDCSMGDLIEPAAARQAAARKKRPARRPASETCVPSGPASMAPGSRDQPRVLRAGRIRPDRADHQPGRGGRTPAGAWADPDRGHRRHAAAVPSHAASPRPWLNAPKCWLTAGPRRPGPSVTCSWRCARRAGALAAVLRAVRQAAADLPAPWPGLVLLGMRAAHRRVRCMREHQAGLLPGPGRAATVRTVPGRRQPRPRHRDSRHHHRAGPACQPGNRRHRRPPFGSPALIPAEAGLGTGRTTRVADGGWLSGTVARDPAVHRPAACRRRRWDRPSSLPRLSSRRAHRQAAGRRAGLPDVHRALPAC